MPLAPHSNAKTFGLLPNSRNFPDVDWHNVKHPFTTYCVVFPPTPLATTSLAAHLLVGEVDSSRTGTPSLTPDCHHKMGNTTSFHAVTHIVETGGLLLDANAFANMSTHGPVTLTFDTVWVADASDAPVGPYMTTSSGVFENLSGKWSGA